jgi:hypothetical protein
VVVKSSGTTTSPKRKKKPLQQHIARLILISTRSLLSIQAREHVHHGQQRDDLSLLHSPQKEVNKTQWCFGATTGIVCYGAVSAREERSRKSKPHKKIA